MSTLMIEIDADLKNLVPGYLDNRRKDIEQIYECLEKGDYETIRRLGHCMKGSGGGYGFDEITDLGAAIEQAAIQCNAGRIVEQLVCLGEYLVKVEIVYV